MVNNHQRSSPGEVFFAFLRLGCLSFGGPIAHLGYFRDAFVERRKWLTEASYAELIALAQSMPGPASSQVGFAIGLLRAGWLGGLAAWTGFTLPSAILMLAFAYGYGHPQGRVAAAALHGLQLVAVAVVAQAVLRMQRTLAPDMLRLAIALAGAVIALFAPPAYATVFAIVAGALAGLVLLRREEPASGSGLPLEINISRPGSAAAASLLVALLVAALLFSASRTLFLAVLASLYRTGALVFGGGHVVLPLLDAAIVQHGWLPQPAFLAGYGAAQALPGPLFSIAAYVGAAVRPNAHPLLLGICSLVALFSPGLLLMASVLPFWGTLRRRALVRILLGGINASVVGVLAAALYRPLITTAVHGLADVVIALAAFVLLARFKVQPWMIVLGVTLVSILAVLR
ncbi:MAG: chromate efflux transporter [Acidobacteriaceae bacterium]